MATPGESSISNLDPITGDLVDVDTSPLPIDVPADGKTRKISVKELVAKTKVFTQSGLGAEPQTVESVLRETFTDFRFMTEAERADVIAGTLSIDVSAKVQLAINAASAAGAKLYSPPGKRFIGTTTLSVPRSLEWEGAGYAHTEFSYSGTGTAIQHNEGVPNTSYYGRVTLSKFLVRGTNASNTNAGIEINALGGAFFYIEYVQVTGAFKYGVIYDACIVAGISNCILENGNGIANSVNFWITNGAERTPGQVQRFSNLIYVENMQYNSAKYGVVDDGGVSHHYKGANFNGQDLPIRIADLEAGSLDMLYLEGQTGPSAICDILFTDTALEGGALKGTCDAVGLRNLWLSTGSDGAGAKVRFKSSNPASFHSGIDFRSNFFSQSAGRIGAVDVEQLRNSFVGFNVDAAGGIGTELHYRNVHYDPSGNTLLLPLGVYADSVGYDTHGNTARAQAFAGGIDVGYPGSNPALRGIVSKIVTTDFDKTTDTVLEDVQDMAFAVKATEEWAAEFTLHVGTRLDFSGIQFAITGPSGTLEAAVGITGDGSNDANGLYFRRTTTLGAAIQFSTSEMTGVTQGLVKVSIWFLTGGSDGTVKLQMAQTASNGNPTRIHKGSRLVAHRVA